MGFKGGLYERKALSETIVGRNAKLLGARNAIKRHGVSGLLLAEKIMETEKERVARLLREEGERRIADRWFSNGGNLD